MPGILELPEVRQRVSPLSVQEYHRLGEFNERGKRTELIRGIVIEKISKSPLHAFLAKLLYDKIAPELQVMWCAARTRSRSPTPSRNRTSQWFGVRRRTFLVRIRRSPNWWSKSLSQAQHSTVRTRHV